MREGAKLPDTTRRAYTLYRHPLILKALYLRLLKLQTSAGEATQTTDEVIATIDNLVHDEGLLALVRQLNDTRAHTDVNRNVCRRENQNSSQHP